MLVVDMVLLMTFYLKKIIQIINIMVLIHLKNLLNCRKDGVISLDMKLMIGQI